MSQQRFFTYFTMIIRLFFFYLLLFPLTLHASFIESTIGTAVVNDATATYHNPAALTLLKSQQIILLGSAAEAHSDFTGKSVQVQSGLTQSGTSNSQSRYYLPSIYVGLPIKDTMKVGFAVISNLLNSDIDETSVLRYTQSSSQIQNIDFVPGLSLQLHEYLSIGAGLNVTSAHFITDPITRSPNLNIPDSQSHNVTNGSGIGENVGFLIKPAKSTVVGFNYRSAVSYQFRGSSHVEGIPAITSNHYRFNFWTPARSVLTMSHFITPSFGLINTIQYVQWSIFKTVIAHEMATQMGGKALILPVAIIPYHFRDTWIFTIGGITHITPKWVIRVAGSYDQSPGNKNYQITNGDGIIAGLSMGYELYNNITIDGSYAHAFIKDQPITISSRNNLITGTNTGCREAVSIKLTIKV